MLHTYVYTLYRKELKYYKNMIDIWNNWIYKITKMHMLEFILIGLLQNVSFFLPFAGKNQRSLPVLQSDSRVLVEGKNTNEQLLFHLFDTLFKCFICPDLPRYRKISERCFLLSYSYHANYTKLYVYGVFIC